MSQYVCCFVFTRWVIIRRQTYNHGHMSAKKLGTMSKVWGKSVKFENFFTQSFCHFLNNRNKYGTWGGCLVGVTQLTWLWQTAWFGEGGCIVTSRTGLRWRSVAVSTAMVAIQPAPPTPLSCSSMTACKVRGNLNFFWTFTFFLSSMPFFHFISPLFLLHKFEIRNFRVSFEWLWYMTYVNHNVVRARIWSERDLDPMTVTDT